MPCYLFTYHAYRSWMPDRPRGFVRRGQGVLLSDRSLAIQYRKNAKESAVTFDSSLQQFLINETQAASVSQNFQAHFIAAESTHVHILLSWDDDRPWEKIRSGLKQSLSRGLNQQRKMRKWFSGNASRRRVKDQEHFQYLTKKYLPSHRGWKWGKEQGCFQ